MTLDKKMRLHSFKEPLKSAMPNFLISTVEQTFCLQRGIPLPTQSPLERLRHLFAFRNEWILFERPCSKTGKSMISCYRPDTLYPVYDKDVWTDPNSFDPRSFGRPYDFNRPFFAQYFELLQVVPRMARIAANIENSPYVNLAIGLNNCYLTFSCLESQDCMYGVRVYNCRDCTDNTYITHCELCYECVNAHRCYNLKWSIHCFDCRDSAFLYGCRNCKDCFGCVGLEHKQYCIWNKQYSREEYESKISNLLDGKRSTLQELQDEWQQFLANQKYQYNSLIGSENCDGQYIDNSHDCHNAYFLRNCENVDDSFNLESCKDCFSTVTATGCQFLYMNMGVRKNSYNVQFSYTAMQLSDAQYTSYVIPQGDHLFGCTGFNQKASYCILNKQYTKEEYEDLVPRIIGHMRSTGEYGQFFPISFSDFPYVDSIAQEFFPLSSAAEAQKLGVVWTDQKAYPSTDNNFAVPDSISEVDESICNQVIADRETKRAFKYQKKEIAFYKAHHIPLPEYCFETRNLKRSKSLLQIPKI